MPQVYQHPRVVAYDTLSQFTGPIVELELLHYHYKVTCKMLRAGAHRRQMRGLELASKTKIISDKLVRERKKKIAAREKLGGAECKSTRQAQQQAGQEVEEHSDDGIDMLDEGWLVPETQRTRRRALAMRGMRTNSVEYLENDDLNHISAQRSYTKSGRYRVPHPFRRSLIEDR